MFVAGQVYAPSRNGSGFCFSIEEVARMLSGAKLTETSRKHAEQMLKANG